MDPEYDPAVRNDMVRWNPWHGCRKKSEGCANCYFLVACERRGIEDGNIVKRSVTNFTLPIDRKRNGSYKVPPGVTVMTTMSGDFFIEDADEWRPEAWEMVRKRPDLIFMVLTKRPERISECLPDDWGDGYPNVHLCVSIENQVRSDERLPLLMDIPCVRRCAFVSPMLSAIDIGRYLSSGKIQDVMCGGEYGGDSRPCDYSWVLSLREQCIENGTNFHWHNAGGLFVKDGMTYRLSLMDQVSICTSSDLDHICVPFTGPARRIVQKRLF